jgi:hypothetical protein
MGGAFQYVERDRESEREGDSHNERKPRFARLDDDQQHGEVEGEREPETAVSRSALEAETYATILKGSWRKSHRWAGRSAL